MASRHYKVGEVANAIKQARGFVSAAAKILGCDPRTVYRYIENHETVKQAIQEAREATKDMAELKLLNRINEGSDTAIIFYLKTQAKDRGYVEKVQNVNINFDPSNCTDEQLIRISNGEDPAAVLADSGGG